MVHHLVERQARLNPAATALRQGYEVWTYGRLEARAEALAGRLRADGLAPGSLVAVVAGQSPELIVAELAILKAGCAFVPVDPSYPRARVDYILGDCDAAAILTTRREKGVVAGCARVTLIDEPDAQMKGTATHSKSEGLPGDLMYVIYTSGSTGRPKGVMVEHHSVCSLIDHFQQAFGVSHSDRSAFLSSSSFDASIVEIWPYLTCGASVHIPETPHLGNAAALFEWMRAEDITTALIATALAEIGISHGFPVMPALRLLLTGGDKLKSHPREVLPFRFINAYGPTECTVISTWSELAPDPGGTRPPSIGKAVPYGFVRILDEDLEAVPNEATGEIYIGGAGVSRGYLHRPELTSERFIQDPLAQGSRLYKTGDRACWRKGGEIAFLGRADRQVQIRGFRVEPAEIEFVLKQEPGVDDAVVAPQERAGYPARLVGFLSAPSSDAGLVAERARARLAATLPGHMHPAFLIVLESLPFNVHGKIDIARLPMPGSGPVAAPEGSSVVADPPSAAATLRALWRAATGAAAVDDADNFFDCGGDSISLTLLLQNIAAATGVQISMGAFLQNPSYGYALELLEGKGGLNLPPTVVPLAPGNFSSGRQSPLFLVAGAGGGVHWFRELVAEMRLERPVYGLESQALTPAARADFTIPGAAAEFLKAVREVQPKGPYLLGGYSLGGLIAMEMADRLRASGEEVEKLVLLDTYAKLPPRNLALLTFTLAKNLIRMQPARRRAFLREKMVWLRSLFWNKRKGNAETELLDLQKRTEMRAGLDYMARLRPCAVLIELFTAQDGTMAWNSTRDRGWLDYAIAGVAVREVPGGHYSLLQTPHVQPLAAELNGNFVRHESLMNWRKRHLTTPAG